MLSICAAIALSDRPTVAPILCLDREGFLNVGNARLRPGTGVVNTPKGIGFDFSGSHSGIELPDEPRLSLTKSVTISAWLYPTAYTNEHNSAPGGQVLFRGDDRSGLDPYHLTVLWDGTVAFAIENGQGSGVGINAPIPLKAWTHVVGALDDSTGSMRLYLNGVLVAQTLTQFRPFASLDPHSRPGVGIGNVQASSGGAHNQPFHGTIVDLRLYDQAVLPTTAGWEAKA